MKRALVILAAGAALLLLSAWLFRGVDPGSVARAAYQRGDYATAVRAYQQAAADCSDLGALAANQAAAFYQLEHFSHAERRYQYAGSTGDELRAARAAYDQGNCALRQACGADGKPEPSLLHQAAEQFRACLAHQDKLADADTLFAAARHNLELTKLLQNPTPVEGQASETTQNSGDHGASEQTAERDQHNSDAEHSHGSAQEQSPDSLSDGGKSSARLASLASQKDDDDDLCPD